MTDVEKPIVVWDGGNSDYVLEVFASGKTVHRQDQTRGRGPVHLGSPVESSLSLFERLRLWWLIRKNAKGLARLSASARNPIAGEPVQKLIVSWNGIEFEKAMLAGDWDHDAGARECAEDLHRLAGEKSKRRK